MEERLDDAINVLRNHAESQVGLHLGPVGPHGGIYSHTSPPQLDHLVRILDNCPKTNIETSSSLSLSVLTAIHNVWCIFQTSPHPAVTVTQPQGSYPGLTPTPDTDGSIKIERLPVTNASKLTLKWYSKCDIIYDMEKKLTWLTSFLFKPIYWHVKIDLGIFVKNKLINQIIMTRCDTLITYHSIFASSYHRAVTFPMSTLRGRGKREGAPRCSATESRDRIRKY